MTGSPSSSAHELVEERRHDRRPFLGSYRALAACTRELARLSDEVLRGVAALRGSMAEEKATVRRSPDRCIVQVGPVALTVAWLRQNSASVADGELLVIVWRGAVAPRHQHLPERPATAPRAQGATPRWEQVLTPAGDSEETWSWQSLDIGRCSSTELAARCIERLRAVYLEREAPLRFRSDLVQVT